MGHFGPTLEPVSSRGEITLSGFFPEDRVVSIGSMFGAMHMYSNEFEWVSRGTCMSGNAYVKQGSMGAGGILYWELELLVSDVQRKPLGEKIPELAVSKIGMYGRRIQRREMD